MAGPAQAVDGVVMDRVIEPWDAPIRTAEESLEMVARLHRRDAERWRRMLASWDREIAEARAWAAERGVVL